MSPKVKPIEPKILVAKLREEDVDKIQTGDKLMILVSVGKENFNIEAMRALVLLLNNITRKIGSLEVVLNVADALQRFNIAALSASEPDEQLIQAVTSGTQWLEETRSVLSDLKATTNVIRWEHWVRHPNYSAAREKILAFERANSEEFHAKMSESIEEYLKRQRKDLGEEVFDRIETRYREYCEQYLREEITTMLLWQETGCKFILYPGKQTAIMEFVLDKLISQEQTTVEPLKLLQWLDVRLARKDQRMESMPKRPLQTRGFNCTAPFPSEFAEYISSMLAMNGARLSPEIEREFMPLCTELVSYAVHQSSDEQRRIIQLVLLQLPTIIFVSCNPATSIGTGTDSRATYSFWRRTTDCGTSPISSKMLWCDTEKHPDESVTQPVSPLEPQSSEP